MANILLPFLQFFDSNGDPLSGGKLYTYAAGTTTPKATYTDSGGGTPNANPVVLDSAGRAQVWISGNYKLVLATSSDAVITTLDNVAGGGLIADGDYGDIVVSSGGTVMTVDTNAISNAKLAQMAANTIKGNATASTANASDISLTTNTALGRLSSNVVAIPIGTSANNLVILDASAKLPAVDGSQLTGVTAVPSAVPVALSGTSSTITVDFTTYSEYELVIEGTTNTGNVTIEASSNGGSSYTTTTYAGFNIIGTTVASETAKIWQSSSSAPFKITINLSQPSTSGAVRGTCIAGTQAGGTPISYQTFVNMAVTAAADRIKITVGTSWTGHYLMRPVGKRT